MGMTGRQDARPLEARVSYPPMKMHLETSTRQLISNYGIGVIGIDGTDYRSNVLIGGGRVVENWYDGAPEGLAIEHFEPLFAAPGEPPEICLLGTGAEHVFPPFPLIAELRARGVALEVMNTRAACRTYSVLVGEERVVAAALVAALHERGIALEAMNTRAACRTYSVLIGEERAVAAALFQIE